MARETMSRVLHNVSVLFVAGSVFWRHHLCPHSRAGPDGGSISSSGGRSGTRRRAHKGQTEAWLHLGNDRSGEQLSAAARSLPETQLHRPRAAALGTRSAGARAARRGCLPCAPDVGVPRRQRGAGDTGSGSSRSVRGGRRAPPPLDPTGCVCVGRPATPLRIAAEGGVTLAACGEPR
ncbi:unnamed protein product [Coccothraustes coccothraustes]